MLFEDHGPCVICGLHVSSMSCRVDYPTGSVHAGCFQINSDFAVWGSEKETYIVHTDGLVRIPTRVGMTFPHFCQETLDPYIGGKRIYVRWIHLQNGRFVEETGPVSVQYSKSGPPTVTNIQDCTFCRVNLTTYTPNGSFKLIKPAAKLVKTA